MVRSLGKINSNFTKHISPVRHNLESSPEKLLEVQANLPPDSLSQGHTSPWCFAEPTEDQVTRMVGELEDMDIGIFGGFNIKPGLQSHCWEPENERFCQQECFSKTLSRCFPGTYQMEGVILHVI